MTHPWPTDHSPPRAAAATLALAALLGGCASTDPSAPSNPTPAGSSAAVAYVAGRAVGGAEFSASLREAAGRRVLEEIVLVRLIEDRLARRGLVLTPDRVEAERARLLRALDADEDVAQRLLARLRERRGLGPERFDRLLRRNAGLRLLVEGEVEVTEAAVRRAFDRSHGPRMRLRLITADTPAAAEALRGRVLGPGASFAEVAAAASTDASRERGGLLGPVHRDDPTLPAAIRAAAGRLEPGGTSPVVALESGSGYAVVRLEAELPAEDTTLEAERAALERAVRADLERAAMDLAARTLRAEADVVVLDPSLAPG